MTTTLDRETDTNPQSQPGASTPFGVSAARGIQLVAKREMLVHLRSKAFLISLAIMLALIAGGIVAMSIFGGAQSSELPKVAVPVASQEVALEAGLDVIPVTTTQEAIDLVTSGEADSAILPAASLTDVEAYDSNGQLATLEDGDQFFVVGLEQPSQDVVNALTQSPAGFALERPEVSPVLGYLLSVAFGVAFFFGALSYSQFIAQSVVEEKQTRVVEILLATVTPRVIMAGKVLGNGAIALGAMASVALVSLITLALTGQTELFALLGPAVIWYLVFFVFGFLLLAALYAGAGAMVSRQEEVATTTMPLMMLIMIPYMLTVFLNTNATAMAVMSYVPFSAPIAMPIRMFLGQAEWWEPVVSLAILIAAAVGAVLLGARIYENSILRTGANVKLKDALAG